MRQPPPPGLGESGDGDARHPHPLRLWFWAAYLVATHTPRISAKQLQRELGLRRYETAWLMLQKLRRAMGAPERTQLRAEVEVDEGFVGGVDPRRRAGGRARVGKRLVAVAVEVRGQGSGRLRLAALPDASKRSLGPWVASNVEPGAIVHTDGWSGTEGGYRGLSGIDRFIEDTSEVFDKFEMHYQLDCSISSHLSHPKHGLGTSLWLTACASERRAMAARAPNRGQTRIARLPSRESSSRFDGGVLLRHESGSQRFSLRGG